MSKHRRKTRHRQITIAAVALGALAVPSAAMACLNDQGSENTESYGQWKNWKNTSSEKRWEGGKWSSQSPRQNSQEATAPASEATTPASQEAAAPASTAAAAPTSTAPTAPASTAAPAPASTPAAAPEETAAASPSASETAAPASGAVAQVVALVNSERSKAGCSPVTLNAKLSKAAQDHSADMASHSNMSHTGSDGSDPSQRITAAGYTWSTYGENVAYGYSTPEEVMAGWMSSPGHKENILNCDFKEIGVGLAQPNDYWTQDFGTAR
ncbi:CAP domain-containing protein [Streptomyces sp. NPDC048275]|uniref:CAP domain-containing protein n=1 Tax=Streptomyces sp. NPDC048275 TaxID=3155629 RepID=UPI003411A91A